MKRYRAPAITAAGGVALVAAALVAAFTMRSDARQPNLLLITVDTLRADRVGAYGWRRAETPAIDGLARRGALFEQAFTVAPVTLPAHASLLTGLLPPRHGIRGNSFYALSGSEATLASVLGARGYRTGAVVAAAVLDRRFGLHRGFDHYDDEMPDAEGGALIAERNASSVVARALAWLDGTPRDAPFFLWVHLFDPHHPYEPPQPVRSMFRDAPYDGEVAYADSEIARVLAALEARGALQDTLIVLTSDHGESLGEHGEETHGVFLYDSTLRVPLIMAGPRVPPGVRIEHGPVSLADVFATVLARLGVEVPAGTDGVDALGAGAARREAVYAETYLPRDFYNWSPLQALRTRDTKFVLAPAPELYDLEADPEERRNLAPEVPQAVARFAARLRETAREPADDGRVVVDDDLARRLQSLGYVAGARPAAADSPTAGRPDPKERIHLVGRLDEALALTRSRQLDAAERVLRSVLAEDPHNYLAAHTLGDAMFEAGRNAEAISAYAIAMRGRDVAYYHYRLATLYERERRYEESARHVGELLRLAPEAAGEVVERAVSLDGADAPAGALAYLASAARVLRYGPAELEARAACVAALKSLGLARGEAGDLRRAEAAFAEAAALAPDDFDAVANLGLTRVRRGNAAAALQPLERAVALRPDATRILNLAAEVRFRRGELHEARAMLVRSLAADPAQPVIARALRDVERRIASAEAR